jgi:hypothetical protein
MTRLIEVLISLAIVGVLFLAVSLVLPSSRHLSEKVETNRKMAIVYDTLNSLRRFKEWNPLVLRDPKVQLKLSGPESGVGARLDYHSNTPSLGDGSWEITATDPGKSVSYALTNPQRGHDKTSTFLLKPSGRGANKRNVEITQTYSVDYGWDLLGRYAGLYVSRHVGDDIKLGLERLSNMLAGVPNVDYNMPRLTGVGIVDRPAENLLVVSAGSIKRDDDALQASMKANMEWIHRTMAANNLVAVGPMRIISTEFGREDYTFDVVQAVARKGAGSTDEAADSDASASTDTAAAAPETAAAGAATPMTGLKLLGPVQYVHTAPTRAVTGAFTGYYVELDNVRNALRAWALTQGDQVTDRPYEFYKNGIEKAFTVDGQYQVFWTLK